VIYNRVPPSFPESSRFTVGKRGSPDTVRCTTRQSGVPGPSWCWLYTTNSFPILFFFFCHLSGTIIRGTPNTPKHD
jgi:hypothetical protein